MSEATSRQFRSVDETWSESSFYPYKSRDDPVSRSSRGFRGFAQLESASTSPWELRPGEFTDWYDRVIVGHPHGIQDFKKKCGETIDQVVQVLYQHLELNVKEVVKGGSLAKGTMLKNVSDVDCVVLLNSLPYLKDVSNMDNYLKHLRRTIDNIETSIRFHTPADTKVVEIRRNSIFMLTAVLNVSGVEMEVDLIPTADNLDKEGKPKIYENMLPRPYKEQNFYSASLVKLQVKFIVEKPGVVKELIRLVKYWNKEKVKPDLCEVGESKNYPRSYPMELITVYAWEKAGSPISFDRLQGFKAVLEVIAWEIRNLTHYWTDNYDDRIAQRGITGLTGPWRESPIILDPANPTNNVCARCKEHREVWNKVVRVAKHTLDSKLLRNVTVQPKWSS